MLRIIHRISAGLLPEHRDALLGQLAKSIPRRMTMLTCPRARSGNGMSEQGVLSRRQHRIAGEHGEFPAGAAWLTASRADATAMDGRLEGLFSLALRDVEWVIARGESAWKPHEYWVPAVL